MYRYDVDIPSTDKHIRNQHISFVGSKEQIDDLKNKKPTEIICTEIINYWNVTYKGSSNGVLEIKAERFAGNKTYLFQKIVSNKVKKFAIVDTKEYNAYEPMDIGLIDVRFVELDDKLERTSGSFTMEYYERKYPKSSIVTVYEFLKDEQFENMVKSIKVEDNA